MLAYAAQAAIFFRVEQKGSLTMGLTVHSSSIDVVQAHGMACRPFTATDAVWGSGWLNMSKGGGLYRLGINYCHQRYWLRATARRCKHILRRWRPLTVPADRFKP
ncbi:hypothetical protein IF1G_07900 [Cordyceps javanica]|uniref:Uncharacterized protein n=1 Tax=Cordyceps javanica TaxID=43265 RepID=A0A545UV43_9HYPO|nr:hypothetical protein IF1G_07900 [Cordyceps javanica]